MKKQWILYVCAVLLVVNLVLTGLMMGGVLPKEEALSSRYTLYIGLSDPDTHTQLISTPEALELVGDICARYVPGYTAMTAYGGWHDDAGELIQEESLVFTFVDATEEQILQIKEEAMAALNQSSILMEYQEVQSTMFAR